MPFGASHYPLRQLAAYSVRSFFKDVQVLGAENCPDEGPLILACSHSNMAVDPAVLSSTLPNGQFIHYWVKDSLFSQPQVGALLRNAGNIPVDRKNKNKQDLFRGTFEVLALNETIAVFPEGTSHTSPHMIPFKDGISWCALEYTKWLSGAADGVKRKGKKALVVPVGINYLDKNKYRSRIVVEYGKPIPMDEYEEQFNSGKEGDAKLAVKRLNKKIELEMLKMTINAPDWDTFTAAKMARELLWEDDLSLAPEQYVKASQTLVDLFSPPTPSLELQELKDTLVTYSNLLTTAKLTNKALSDLPLPRTLDPSNSTSLPSRFSTLSLLLWDTLACAIRLPFFFLPLVIHLPLYGMARLGADLVKEEQETQAQMKIAFGILCTFLLYPILFCILWSFLGWTTIGAILAAGAVYAFAMYHASLVDDNYERIKRLIAAWRVLVGVWAPKGIEIAASNLLSYLPKSSEPDGATPTSVITAYTAGQRPPPLTEEEKAKKRKRRVASRRLIRHVLRTRVQSARSLESYLHKLETQETDVRVHARPWLAAAYGGTLPDPAEAGTAATGEGPDGVERFPSGTRSGKEVVEFLRQRRAKVISGNVGIEGWHEAISGDEKSGDEGEESAHPKSE